jgi:hypothetical protein
MLSLQEKRLEVYIKAKEEAEAAVGGLCSIPKVCFECKEEAEAAAGGLCSIVAFAFSKYWNTLL